jgi:[protein-PII] uridylyltransferase
MIVENRRSSEPSSPIKAEFFASRDAARALESRTAAVDEVTAGAFRDLFAVPETALLAVGGYGRRELFPYSDVDLLLLVGNGRNAAGLREPISAYLRRLWDSGLRISHSVRTPAECLQLHDHNLELNISLLDVRFLAGDRGLYDTVAQRLPKFIHSQRDQLARSLSKLTRERYAKQGDTLYHLEPNVKETLGGLRDLQLIRWLAQIRGGGAGGRFDLAEPAAFLSAVRCYLHYDAGRDANTLTFDAQDWISEQWHSPDPASWMREYYRSARAIQRRAIRALEASEGQSSSLLAQFRDWRSRLSNADFTVLRDRVSFRSPAHLEADPSLLLSLFQFVGRHGIRLSEQAEERISANFPALEQYFRQAAPQWEPLRDILLQPHVTVALRAMHDTGVMRAIFPETAGTECLVIRDFYHRYTVDEHTLVAIQGLEQLRESRDPAQKPYADLYLEIEDPAPLTFALLFHDAGKADPHAGHVDASVRCADSAMERINMPGSVRDEVRFLIAHHLDLSAAMNGRDLHDPETARFMAERIGTVERLRALTLLTWADINAVNPAAMSPWRGEQLWQTYLITYNELTRELHTQKIDPNESGDRAAFLEGFPKRYLRTHSDAEIDAHIALEQRSRTAGVAVEIRKVSGIYELILVTGDRPHLLASVAGTLSSFGMNIVKAEAFSNRRGIVLDSFKFVDPSRTLELNPQEVDRLRLQVERVLMGRADVQQLLQNRPNGGPPSRKGGIAPAVFFDDQASGSATLIQIVAQDRPGLLYDLASRISAAHCNIEVVLIDTEAHKAIDVFYVTLNGSKVPQDIQQQLKQELVQVCA